MSTPDRRVTPEILDDLPPEDPRAMRARRDLRRVHFAMRSVTVLDAAVARLGLQEPPRRILELGAGDGTLLLRYAGQLKPSWPEVELTLLDRNDLVSPQTRAAYAAHGWRVTVLETDVHAWAAGHGATRYDLCVANLFLHHFEPPALLTLFRAIARSCDALVACEPRRSRLAQLGSRLVVFLGANSVTREDAVKSVDAGFQGEELSLLWRRALAAAHAGQSMVPTWTLEEYAALPFTHCFTARRAAA